MRAALLILIAHAACEPAPGETRCSTTMVYGTAFTRCRTRSVDPPPALAPQGFWCTTRPDGFGFCAAGDRGAGDCEAGRAQIGDVGFAPCAFAAAALCAPSGCFVTLTSCAIMERQAGRDGSACTVRH